MLKIDPKLTIMIYGVFPIIIVILTVVGVFLGFYLAERSGEKSITYPILFSTLGLLISLCIIYIIARRLSSEEKIVKSKSFMHRG